jgi:hypothetical protein
VTAPAGGRLPRRPPPTSRPPSGTGEWKGINPVNESFSKAARIVTVTTPTS